MAGDIVKAAKDLLCPLRSLIREFGFNHTYACQAVLLCGQEESGPFKVIYKLEAVIFSQVIIFCNTRLATRARW
jgi:hypothetical protein